MLDIIRYPIEKQIFYQIGFAVYEPCTYDYCVDPFTMFVKEIAGSTPMMDHLMDELVRNKYIVKNGEP